MAAHAWSPRLAGREVNPARVRGHRAGHQLVATRQQQAWGANGVNLALRGDRAGEALGALPTLGSVPAATVVLVAPGHRVWDRASGVLADWKVQQRLCVGVEIVLRAGGDGGVPLQVPRALDLARAPRLQLGGTAARLVQARVQLQGRARHDGRAAGQRGAGRAGGVPGAEVRRAHAAVHEGLLDAALEREPWQTLPAAVGGVGPLVPSLCDGWGRALEEAGRQKEVQVGPLLCVAGRAAGRRRRPSVWRLAPHLAGDASLQQESAAGALGAFVEAVFKAVFAEVNELRIWAQAGESLRAP